MALGGAQRDLAARQRRLQHRPRPHRRGGDGPAGPAQPARGQPILVRADSAGATHAFVDDIVRRNLRFSIGFDCDSRVQAAILALPEQAWQPAVDADGRLRRGAWVAELATLDIAGAGWPEGTRAICRRERPHPGARHKMGFTDAARHRFQVFITNQPDPDPVVLEARHRPHARVEDRIRGAKASGLRNLPFWGFAANDAWLTLVMIAQTLVCWAQALLLDGDCKLAELDLTPAAVEVSLQAAEQVTAERAELERLWQQLGRHLRPR